MGQLLFYLDKYFIISRGKQSVAISNSQLQCWKGGEMQHHDGDKHEPTSSLTTNQLADLGQIYELGSPNQPPPAWGPFFLPMELAE